MRALRKEGGGRLDQHVVEEVFRLSKSDAHEKVQEGEGLEKGNSMSQIEKKEGKSGLERNFEFLFFWSKRFARVKKCWKKPAPRNQRGTLTARSDQKEVISQKKRRQYQERVRGTQASFLKKA